MKKKRIILASILGATVFIAGASAVTVAVINNNNNKLQEEQNEYFIESTTAEDNVFAAGMPSLIANREVKRLNNNVVDLTKPQIGYQYALEGEGNSQTVSIRYFAAIKDPNVTATWTRALYDNEGKISSKLPMATKQSTVAYEKLAYMDGSEVKYISASEYGCSYFVVYSLVGIPVATYKNYNLVAKVELSDGSNSVQSDAGSITTSNNPAISKIEAGIYLNSTTKSHNGYNGTYIYNQVKTLYNINEDLDLTNVSVVLSNEEVTSSGYTKGSTTGKQTVTLTCGDTQKQYDVYVLNIENQITDSCVATVDQSYADSVIGTLDSTDGYRFKTISQALEFLQNTSFVASTAEKTLNIKAGTYNEKLEINTPNLTIVGASSATTTIEYDSLYGTVEANGFNNVTDSTQTVAVRKTATNCKISGVTISNKYNSIESFAETKYAGNGERGLALLVQADQLYVDSCKILGWQDTLELFTGRQYFKNTYISGCIDYIFGTNNTTFFDGCEIHTVKGKTGANSENVNAYVTAFKGTNYDDGRDSVAYGAIFKGCNFTSDTGFVGKYALARPWKACSSVAALNSTFDGNFDTDEARTIATGLLSDVNLSSLNIKFYGNKDSNDDDLSLTEGLSNVDTSLTSSEAADYLDFDVVFGRTNGNVSYDLAWDPDNGLEEDTSAHYYFDATEATTGNFAWRGGTDGKAVNGTLGGLTINTNKCKYNSDQGGYTELQAGTITFNVSAKSLVSIRTGFGSGTAYSLTGSVDAKTYYPSAQGTVSYYFESAQTITMTITAKVYLLELSIESNATNTMTYSGVGLSTSSIEIYEGDSLDLSGLKVYAEYTSGCFEYLDNTQYTRTGTVDTTTPGSYSYRYTYNEEYEDLNITVKANVVESLSVTNYKTTYGVGDSFDDDMTVTATYSNSSNIVLDVSEYDIDISDVDFSTAGTYQVVVTYKADTSITKSFNVTVSAGEYTVTFMDGDTVKSTSTGTAGSAITYPSDTTKSGYQFVRYYSDSSFTQVYDETETPSENITVYMRYIELNKSGITYVSTADDLVSAINSNSVIYLTSDIDMTTATTAYSGKTDNFTGSVYGYGYSIRNWSVSNAAQSTSFFGKTYAGVLDDMIFDNCHITTDSSYVSLLTSGSYASETINKISFIDCYVKNYSETAVNCYSGLIAGAGNLGEHNNLSDLLVSNIKCVNSYVSGSQYSGGLFGNVNKGNIVVDGLSGNITFNSLGSSCKNAGGVIGWVKDHIFTLKNSNITIEVNGIDGSSQNLGGVVGGIQNNSTVTGVVITNSTIDVEMNNVNSVAGGVVGLIYTTTTLSITNSTVVFDIDASGESIGGIAGRSSGSVTLNTVTLNGKITANYRSAAVVGYINLSTAGASFTNVIIGNLEITNSNGDNSANTVYGKCDMTSAPDVSGVSYDSTKVNITRGGTKVTTLQGTDTAA